MEIFVAKNERRLFEEALEFFDGEGADEGFFGEDGGGDELFFLLLELDDFFFDGAVGDEFVGGDDFGLAHAVCA